jgi:hypothetical protein
MGMDILDKKVFELIINTCKVLHITVPEAADAFGDYWVNVYAAAHYKDYYKDMSNAKEFIMKMDEIHESVTKNIENARPPRF